MTSTAESYEYMRIVEWEDGRMANEQENDLLSAAKNAAATLAAIYQWVERCEAAGGATSIDGVATCNAMLKSLRKNADRTEALIMVPLRAAIEARA